MTLAWDAASHDWLAAWLDDHIKTGKTSEGDDQEEDDDDDGE